MESKTSPQKHSRTCLLLAENYEPAKSNEEDIIRQVMEEVDRGTIIHIV